jgi:hypothetical protein
MDAIDLTEEDQSAEAADVEALEVQLVSVEAELQEVTCYSGLPWFALANILSCKQALQHHCADALLLVDACPEHS